MRTFFLLPGAALRMMAVYEETRADSSGNTRFDGQLASFLASETWAFPSPDCRLFPGAPLRLNPFALEELGIGPDGASGEYPRAFDPVPGTTS